MKYRGVNIIRVEYLEAIDIGKREDTPVKPVIGRGYSFPEGKYPDTLEGAKQSIDSLIASTMKLCDCDEKRAVQLINDPDSVASFSVPRRRKPK